MIRTLSAIVAAFSCAVASAQVLVSPILQNSYRVYPAESYGAAPNDTGGDNAAIQNALTAASNAGGGIVTISQPGIYWLDSPTAAPNTTYNSALLIGSNTRLVLAEGVVIKLRPQAVCYMIRNSSPTAKIQTIAGEELVNPMANTNIVIEGGTWDANASAINVIDGVIASDGVTITSTGFNGYTYTSGDAAYIWWAAPAATHTGATNSTAAVTSTGNCTGVVANQYARIYTRTAGDTTVLGNYVVASPTSNGFTATGLTGTGAGISFDLYPITGSVNISSANGTNSITLASSVGVSKTSNGFTNARVTISTQNNTPSGGSRTWLGHAMAFSGVDGITIRNLSIINCSKYSAVYANCTNILAENVLLNNRKQGGDGLHVQGPARGIVFKNIRGVTDDNLIGVTPSEGTYFQGGSAQTGGTTSAALSGGFRTLTKTSAFSSSDVGKYVTITGGTGVTAGIYLINGFTDTSNVTLATDPGGSGSSVAFYINGWAVSEFGEGDISDVLIDGVYGDTDAELGPGYELVRFVGKSTQQVRNVKVLNVSGYVRKGAAVKLADDANGQLTGCVMRDILIDGVNVGSEYGQVYIIGSGVKDVTCRNVWSKEAVLASLTNVSTNGTATITAANQFITYTGIGTLTTGFTALDQIVFTSGANAGSRFFIDNTVSNSAVAPLSSSTINVYTTFPTTGTGQTAEIRRTPGPVWVSSACTIDSLTIRDCGTRNDSNVCYTGYFGFDGTIKNLIIDGAPMILGNNGIGINISTTGVVNYGVLSRLFVTDNGSGNSYSIQAKNTSTRSYLTLSDSQFVGAGATLRGIYAAGLLDLTVAGVRFGGHASLRPFETNTSADLNVWGAGIAYGPTFPTAPFTVTAGTMRLLGEGVLIGTGSLTLNTGTANTVTLLTSGASSNAVITKIVVTNTAVSSPTGGPAALSVGVSAAYTEVLAATTLPNMTASGAAMAFIGKDGYVLPSSAALVAKQTTGWGSGSTTVRVDVYGYYR